MDSKIIIAISVILVLLLVYFMRPAADGTTKVPVPDKEIVPEPTPETAPTVVDTTPMTWIRKVRISQFIDKSTQTFTPFIALGELMIYDGHDRNIARGAKVTMSSNFDGAKYPASNLTDGDINTVAHTRWEVGKTEWVEVELPAPVTEDDLVKRIVVHTMRSFESRIVGAKLQLFNNLGDIQKEWEFSKTASNYTFAV